MRPKNEAELDFFISLDEVLFDCSVMYLISFLRLYKSCINLLNSALLKLLPIFDSIFLSNSAMLRAF